MNLRWRYGRYNFPLRLAGLLFKLLYFLIPTVGAIAFFLATCNIFPPTILFLSFARGVAIAFSIAVSFFVVGSLLSAISE